MEILNHASSHINSRFLFSRIGCAFAKFAKYKRLENNPLYGTICRITQGHNIRIISVRIGIVRSQIDAMYSMLMCPTTFYKRLSSMLSEKRYVPYNTMIGWVRCRLSFALPRASIMAIRGARSSRNRPPKGVQ